MNKIISLILVIILVSALILTGCAPKAEKVSPEEFFSGKTIPWIVGYGAGGGMDAYSRLIAPFLEKYTGATVIVQNMPGAGGSVAVNHMYNTAKPDGLTIAIAPGRMALSQLLGEEFVNFDFAKFTFLGRIVPEMGVVLVGADSAYAKMSPSEAIEAMKAASKLKYAGESSSDITTIAFALASHALGFKPKMIFGYKGTAEATLAVIRGECDVTVTSGSSAAKYIKGGDLVAKFVIGSERASQVPDVPALTEVVKLSEEGQWSIKKAVGLYRPMRLVIAPPGVPEERAKFLADGIYKALHDQELLAQSKKIKRPIDYASPEDVAADVNEILGMDEASKEKLKYIILEKFK